MTSKESEAFGQRRPPLSVTIKGILERYPDGQIFKEMIQNADDAGAKTVWFYVDERQHGTSNLPHPELAKFQGPALVAGNDACFTNEDWEGIQSLQQSIKAEDPFKVGRFGIGFNSVYHLTDLPVIVSGNRLACFEPQEKIWKGESGQSFSLPSLVGQQSDIVATLNGLAGFDSQTIARKGQYSHTLFRLPLRSQASGLSDNIYTIQKLQELLDALREEAKYLLLFLKSVNKIEVVRVSQFGQNVSFCVEIAPASRAHVSAQRESFMQQLQLAHSSRPFRISNVISFTAKFSVVVTDNNPRRNKGGTSNWLIANCVGSPEPAVQQAAVQQHTFPWVGAVLELGASNDGGRIFCFLPMPVEASSGLPIHVNGTFGLNDERRTLKWPGIERRNDPTANWNKLLVSQLLPPCYVKLLIEAKNHLTPELFYKAWPEVKVVKKNQFVDVLQPLFTALFRQAVVRTEKTEALREVGDWIIISQATFISEGSNLPSIMHRVLSNCGVQLVTVPSVIWAAIRHNKAMTTEVSPQLARSNLRSYPHSYSSIDPIGKRVLLQYCLSDGNHNDLKGLNLLPLANGNFTSFDTGYYSSSQLVYLCSSDCPRYLLPNLESQLVDVSDDPKLQQSLYQVASSQQTKLRVLTEVEVASLLPQAMPSSWNRSTVVSMPNQHFSLAWLQLFWNWLQNKNIKLFNNQLIVPCYQSTSHFNRSFYLIKLGSQQAVVYVSRYTSCSSTLLSALYKMSVFVCQQSEFSFVQHRQLASYMRQFDTNSVLDTIAQQSNYTSVAFTAQEADSLRTFFISSPYSPNSTRRNVLQGISIFASAANSSGQLHSVSTAASNSLIRTTLGEPSNSAISVGNLPANLILLSRNNHHQLQLLQALQITFLTDVRLLLDYIFPLIRKGSFPDHLIDNLMSEVLDAYQVLNSREYNCSINSHIQSLPFIRISSGYRKSPADLCDPYNENLKALYDGEDVFPLAPFNTPQRILVLRTCGLRTSVTPQQVLDIIYSISSAASSQPQRVDGTKLGRAKAVLEYISTLRQPGGYYTVAISRQHLSFSDALKYLATNRSWLPVCSEKPSGYPEEISWKGEGYYSHFVSLKSSVSAVTPSTNHTLPHLVGTQMYLVDPPVQATIANMLPTDSNAITQHVVAHFKEILDCKDQLSVSMMDSLVHRVYSHLEDYEYYLSEFYSIPEWIYIKKEDKFVSPAVVALKQNPTFRQNLEPYVYILPDSLSRYSALFNDVTKTVSQAQILSVLKTIKDDVEGDVQRTSALEAWGTVMSILNWLTGNSTKKAPDATDGEVYVPVESESDWPQLMEASEVVYTDNDFLKNYLQSTEQEESHTFVHDGVNPRLAQNLGVVPLSEYLDISEDTFEDAGQHEPLTTRLKNILKDYKDGLTIIKELLQNADDAEATEVNICYDARNHEQDPKRLFFSGMAEAHGPALVVHNNKTFSDDDFKNITKLAGATKQAKALKIGKFGIGFCSVYHMTDVPSFISRDKLYIFDPTLSYLKKEIKNPGQPGKKTQFTHKFISGSKQLSPYDGLFGFDRTDFEGTMFRLPFRTSASELSGTCYSESTVQELVSAIKESSSSLLLFLQHVRCVTFQRIDQGQSSPSVLLRVTQECVPLPIGTPDGTEIRKLTAIQPTPAQNESCDWLVSQQSEEEFCGEYYTASVACPLGQSSSYKIDPNFQGEIFCFLPLAQKTGLPVHVSSNFAVINNRRGIWTSDDATSQTDTEVQWNISLMQGVIPRAYHALLVALKKMTEGDLLRGYAFHSLWPLDLQQRNPWEHMIAQLYEMIGSDDLFYSAFRNQWLHLTSSKFLESGILSQSSGESSTPSCVLKIVQYLEEPVVDLPQDYHQHFQLEECIIGESEFIELFFENLNLLEEIFTERNETIQYMLEEYMAHFDYKTTQFLSLECHFHEHPCIPCGPDGTVLRMCNEVIDPSAKFVDLYDPDEARFPIEALTKRELSLAALRKLGMLCTSLPHDMLIERAQTVPTLYEEDQAKALKRVHLVLSTDTTASEYEEEVSLSSIPFLPVLSKPCEYPLSWKGDDSTLMCGEDLMIPRTKAGPFSSKDDINVEITGSQVTFVNDGSVTEGGCGYIRKESLKLLQIRHAPTCEEVIVQFEELIETFSSQKVTQERVDKMCRRMYEFLDGQVDQAEEAVIQQLRHMPCVWTGESFISVEVISEGWKTNGPYLYSVPSSLSFRKNLTKALKVKKEFSFSDIHDALGKMSTNFGDQPLDDECQSLFRNLIPLLDKCHNDGSSIMLPDEDFVMHSSSDMSFNDAPWAPKDKQYTYVNDKVTRQLAEKFRVTPVRTKFLDKYISNSQTHFRGAPFGQREDLTRRIQNILQGYPFDITVLKELLQNTDDAKATKMYVILDKRTHGKQGILSDNWGQLQGPALLVWNNSEFSEKDLKGIQELGLGSKGSDSETIGQFGIGFNVVYHLTDCPSFITGGETMCVLDPHCRYVPGAEANDPGRRYDRLSEGFWDTFQDMNSAYLQSGLTNCPSEVQKSGSLFRFPLRHTLELVRMSEILKKESHSMPKPLTGDDMHKNLTEWGPKMKEAMFFLNHVTELRFFVIEERSQTMVTLNNYRTQVDSSAQEDRVKLHAKLSAFKNKRGNESLVIRYPLTISSITHKKDTEHSVDERWLIQQGVGDIENDQQTWTYVDNIKPRHGIAAPILLPPKPQTSGSFPTNDKEVINGQLFCFLPLPVRSKLPVHINGHFILDSSRREVWHSTEADREDDKSAWNQNIYQAIASSYANFLENAQDYYVSKEQYKTFHDAFSVLNRYYNIFPCAESSALDKRYLSLAENVYRKLVAHNPSILAVVHSGITESKTTKVQWCPLESSDPSTQVYFWKVTSYLEGVPEHEKKHIKPVIEKLGMQLTAAPARLQHHINKVIKDGKVKLKETTPSTVYAYYRQFNGQAIISESTTFPCSLDDTIFKRVEVFERFTDYLLKPSDSVPNVWEFPDKPFGLPLLLTADNTLRRFDSNHKVLRSQSSHLFPKSLHLFLHQKLLNTMYSQEYFASSQCGDLICSVLSVELPDQLTAVKVLEFEQHISKERLKALWDCFANDSTFSSQLEMILNQWALIPSVGGQLYSYKNSLLPLYPPAENQTLVYSPFGVPSLLPKPMPSSVKELYPVLSSLKMPFIDRHILSGASPSCPELTDHVSVLKNLFFLSKEVELSSLLTKEMIMIIFNYLSKIDFRSNSESLKHLKSLPLFENVSGSFSSIEGKSVFVWHSSTCSVAYDKWIQRSGVIFLYNNAAWTRLGSEQLSINTISAEATYSRYIFDGFFTMNEKERYKHLEHIKDYLFRVNKANSKPYLANRKENREEYYRALTFINGLEKLCCVGGDEEPLKPVRDFCDHTLPIFTAFKRRYNFLPEFFTNPKVWKRWETFFRELGLKKTVSKEEFLELCQVTADSHDDPEKASRVLLNDLFSYEAAEAGWDRDISFCNRVASIPFVPAQQLPELRWIREPPSSSKRIHKEERVIDLTKLSGAASPCNSECLWTVKHIVQLPTYSFYSELVKRLGVATGATVEDVISNLKNICTMKKFTDFKFFDQYPPSNKPPEVKGVTMKTLMEVMVSQFHFLQSKQMNLSTNNKEVLKNLPCIPVYNTFEKKNTQSWKIVLVKPCYVLSCPLQGYHPFLHSLPSDLKPILGLLSEIGVCGSLEMKHFRLVLERAFKSSEGQKLDQNTKACVATTLKDLKEKLTSCKDKESAAGMLTPLYLPSSRGILVSSTDLLYADASSFMGRIKSQVEGADYSLLEMLSHEYGFSEMEFCDLLPASVRPKGLSGMCDQMILDKCKQPVSPCDVHIELKETLSLKDDLPKAIFSCIKHHTEDKSAVEKLEHIIVEFVSSIDIVTVQHVRTSITFKQTGTPIGELDLQFHLQPTNDRLCLYISSKLKTVDLDDILRALTKRLLSIAKRMVPNLDSLSCSQLTNIFTTLLRLKNPSDFQHVLKREGIAYETKAMNEILFELGKEVSEDWHHRLDQTIENVFHPGEIVGYEEVEGRIIIARIMHPIIPDGADDLDSVPLTSMKFQIRISPDDEEGIEVGILTLYKFLKGLKPEKKLNVKEKGLMPYEGETEPIKLQKQLRREDLADIISELKKQLDEIWKLPENEREKAIRRLYLKWHPDKNPDNPDLSEEVFKILNSEIDKRKGGRFDREDLNRTARQQRDNYYREKQYYRYPFSSGRGGGFGGGASGYSSGSSSFGRHGSSRGYESSDDESHDDEFGASGWGGGDSSRVPPFDQDNLQPESDPAEGRRWLKQAQANFQTLLLVLTGAQTNEKVCADVCFMAHQVAEKALKGGKYFVCGLDEDSLKSHNISTHAYGLQSERPGETHGLVSHTTPLEKYYLNPRYPNRWNPPTVPADQYDYQEAEQAKNHAEAVLNIIQELIEGE